MAASSSSKQSPCLEVVRNSVPHVKQIYNWDCGITCLKMVCLALGYDEDSIIYSLRTAMKNNEVSNSTWTIDLAYLAVCFMKIKEPIYYTKNPGVDDSYSSMPFYKGKIDKDRNRVLKLFKEATSHRIKISIKSILTEEIEDIMTDNQYILIALVDATHLKCLHCMESRSGRAFRVCSNLGAALMCLSGSYQGHYIVVTKFSPEHKHVYYQDPNFRHGLCYCTYDVFDEARGSDGTDEDLLFIKKSALPSEIDPPNDQPNSL